MRRYLIGMLCGMVVGCGRPGPALPSPALHQAGCYVFDDMVRSYPFSFPDTLELAAEWFLPNDSTGARLRVVRPRDASRQTYAAWGGRFWWTMTGDSVTVTKSDGVTGTVLSLPMTRESGRASIRTFGGVRDGTDASAGVAAQRIDCAALDG